MSIDIDRLGMRLPWNWGKEDSSKWPCPQCNCSRDQHKVMGGIHSKDCDCRVSQHYWDYD